MIPDAVKLTRQSFRVAIKTEHPNSDGDIAKTVDGFVTPSGVFGIDRRIDIERQAKAGNDGLRDSDELWIVSHIPTGRRIGFQLSFNAAHRNVDHLEHYADEMNTGEFSQDGSAIFPEGSISKLACVVYMAEQAAQKEFGTCEPA